MSDDLNPQTNFAPAEVFVVNDLDTLKVIADALRLRIRSLLYKPKTVKQVAEELDLPPTKLYYHINLLEKHGFIVLVDTRVVSGIIEKQYQASSRTVRVARHLLSPDEESGEAMSLTLSTFFDVARDELIQSVRQGNVNVEGDDDTPRHHGAMLEANRLYLTDEQAATFFEEVKTLFTRYNELSRNQHEIEEAHVENMDAYYYMYALFPGTEHQPYDDEQDTESTLDHEE